MKRIAAHIGLPLFCALAAAFYLPEIAVIVIMAAAFVLCAVFLIVKKTRRIVALPVISAVIGLACGIHLLYTAVAVTPTVEGFCGSDIPITATLTDEPYKNNTKYHYPLRTETVGGEEAHIKLLLTTDKPLDAEPFDTVSFTSDIIPTEYSYYLTKGYYVSVIGAHGFTVTPRTDALPLYGYAIRLRQSMRDALDAFLPADEASLCRAVLIGDKYALSPTIRDEFKECGASYFIVVSGMHFAILCWLFLRLFSRLFRRRYLCFPMMYLVILLYMTVTGFQPSVVRSGVMMVIFLTAKWIRRQYDALSSLGTAGMVVPILFSPYGCADMGMILSFAATFSIIMWQTPIYSKLSVKKVSAHKIGAWLIKAANVILSIFSTGLAALILVLPLSVFLFNGFSLMPLILSTLLYLPIYCLMILAVCVCVLYYLGPLRYLAILLSWPLYAVSKLILWLVHLAASVPFAYIRVRAFWFYLWVIVTLALLLLAYFLRGRFRLTVFAVLLSALFFTVGISAATLVQLNTHKLEIIPGRSGAAVCLDYHGRIHLLRFDVDTGSAFRIKDRLTDEYPGAQTAVCSDVKEQFNYSLFSENYFPVTQFLRERSLADDDGSDPYAQTFGGADTFLLDDGVVLQTAQVKDKMLLYLVHGDDTMLMIPAGYPASAVPLQMCHADVILLEKASYDYSRLSCDTLLYFGKQSVLAMQRLPAYRVLCDERDLSYTLQENVAVTAAVE